MMMIVVVVMMMMITTMMYDNADDKHGDDSDKADIRCADGYGGNTTSDDTLLMTVMTRMMKMTMKTMRERDSYAFL